MSPEYIPTPDFTIPPSDHRFPMRYESPREEAHEQMEARNVATAMGQIMERVATRVMLSPVDLDRDQKAEITQALKSLIGPLHQNVSLEKSRFEAKGKTLSRESVIPFCLDALERQKRWLNCLTRQTDQIFDTNLTLRLKRIVDEYQEDKENMFTKTKICYLIDGAIVAGKLMLGGIGEDLKSLGEFVPDIALREVDNGNLQTTQLDGLFLKRDGRRKPGELKYQTDREDYVRGTAVADPNYSDSNPPTLIVPGLLEIKTLFRPRWTVGNLSRKITDYHMRFMMQGIGEAYLRAGIAILPQNIVFIRLRSLDRFSITIQPTDLNFYRNWLIAISNRFSSIEPDNEAMQQALGPFMMLLQSHTNRLTKVNEKRLSGKIKPFKTRHASQERMKLKVERVKGKKPQERLTTKKQKPKENSSQLQF